MLRLLCAVTVICAATVHGAMAQTRGLSSLAWMSGSWGATIDGVAMEEHWTSAAGTMMVGMHRDVAASRTSFEFLRIEVQAGQPVYLASPGGRAPATPFPMKELAGTRVVFENLTHDFPQRIIYWKDGTDLRARVEGSVNGKTTSEEWRWSPLPAK